MATPSGARRRATHYVFHYGLIWEPEVDDSNASEGDLDLTANIHAGPTLSLFHLNETRVINGESLSWGTAGNQSWTKTSGGIAGRRWAKVMAAYTDGQSALQPIKAQAEVGDDPDAHWFRIDAWAEGLAEGGFGGSRLQLTIHDPKRLHQGIFVEGRSVAVRVTEYEWSDPGGSPTVLSDVELFAGFVLPSESDDAVSGAKGTYAISCGTIEQLIGREGMDAAVSLFMSRSYAHSADVADPMLSPEIDPGIALIAAHPYHVMDPLNPFKVLAHLMLWHFYIWVDGARRRLAEVCDLRCDFWNIPAQDIPLFGVPQGNLLRAVAQMLPQANMLGYSFRTGDLTVTPHDESKVTADTAVDSIDTNAAYAIRLSPGRTNAVGQVLMVQSVSTQFDLDTPPIIAKFPASKGQGSIHQPPFAIFFSAQADGNNLCEAVYDRLRSQDRVVIHLAGYPLGLHNKFTYAGSSWTVESVRLQQLNPERMGGLSSWVLARKLV
jgi:hypothetical protein